jgi:DNA-binding MarR family transcriptional regulator
VTNPLDRLDDTIHAKARLGILVVLAVDGALAFSALRDRLELTDGNLSRHLQTLEAAGYVAVHKEFRARRPVTTISITAVGRNALERYLDHLGHLLERVTASRSEQTPRPRAVRD